MELTTGVWTNRMLAEWFEIKENTFRSKKKQKLQELKEYADFYEENDITAACFQKLILKFHL